MQFAFLGGLSPKEADCDGVILKLYLKNTPILW